eukprot:13534618-Ditylum_brightwellii.AAC.1
MNGHIFDYGVAAQADTFTKTLAKTAEFSGCKCKEPRDIKRAIERLEDEVIPVPQMRTNLPRMVASRLLKKDLDTY